MRIPFHNPFPASRSPEEQQCIREHHREEYDAGLDDVDSSAEERKRERREENAMQAAMMFAAGIACCDTLGSIV